MAGNDYFQKFQEMATRKEAGANPYTRLLEQKMGLAQDVNETSAGTQSLQLAAMAAMRPEVPDMWNIDLEKTMSVLHPAQEGPQPARYEDAIVAASKNLRMHFSRSASAARDMDKIADRVTYQQLRSMGLIGEKGDILGGLTQDDVQSLRRSHLYNLAVLHADLTSEEWEKGSVRALRTLATAGHRRIEALMTDLQAKQSAGTANEKDIEELTKLQEQWAIGKELISRAGERAVQQTVWRGFGLGASLGSKPKEDLLYEKIIGVPRAQGRREAVYGVTDLIGGPNGRFVQFLTDSLELLNPDGSPVPASWQKAVNLAYRDAFKTERLVSLGVQEEYAAQMTPEMLVMFTHPQTAARVGRAAVRAMAEPKASGTPKVAGLDVDPDVDFLPSMAAVFGGLNESPRVQLLASLDHTKREGLAATDAFFRELGGRLGIGAQDLADVTNSLLDDPTFHGKKMVGDFIADGVRRGLLDADTTQMEPATAQKIRDLQASALSVSEDTVLPHYGNPLRAFGMLFATEEAEEVAGKLKQLGFGFDVLREAYKEQQHKAFGKLLGDGAIAGFTQEEYETRARAIGKVFNDPNASTSEKMGAFFDSLVNNVGYNWRQAIEGFAVEPETMVPAAAAFAAAGAGVAPSFSQLYKNYAGFKSAFFQRLHMRTVLDEAMRTSPEASQRIQQVLAGIKNPDERVRLAINALDTINKSRRINRNNPTEARRVYAEHIDNARAAFREMSPLEYTDFIDSLQLDAETKRWALNPTGLQALAGRAMDTMGLRMGRKRLKLMSANLGKIATRIVNNPSVPADTLPINPELLGAAPLGMFEKIFPSMRQRLAVSEQLTRLAHWLDYFQADMIRFVDHATIQRGDLHQFLELQRRVQPQVRAEIDELARRLEKAPMTAGLKGLSRLKFLADSDPYQTMTWLIGKYGDSYVYRKMAKKAEKPAAFWLRMANLATEPEGFNKLIFKKFFEYDSIDAAKGARVFNRGNMPTTAADMDKALAMYERLSPQLGRQWTEIKRIAAREKLEGASPLRQSRDAFILSQMLTDDPRLMAGIAGNTMLQGRRNLNAYMAQINAIQDALNRLDPSVRHDVDYALAKIREGKFESFGPEVDAILTKLLGTDTPERKLADDIFGFQRDVLRNMHAAGMISDATFKELYKPYLPSLYRSLEVGRAATVFGSIGEPGMADKAMRNISALEARRDPKKWKLIISPGEGKITRLFESEAAANDYIAKNLEPRKLKAAKREGLFVGTGPQGERLALLAPSQQAAKALGPRIRPTAAWPMQMRRFVEDIFHASFFNHFDVPGLAYKDLASIPPSMKHVKVLGRTFDRFVKLPKSALLGKLSGKYVDRRIVHHMADYGEAQELGRALGRLVEDDSLTTYLANKMRTDPTGIMPALLAFEDVAKKSIVAVQITASHIGLLTQVLSDMFVFSQFADPTINVTKRGIINATGRALRMARKMVKGEQLDAEELRAFQLGVVDEQLVGTGSRGNRRVKDVEALYSEGGLIDRMLTTRARGDAIVAKMLQDLDRIETQLKLPNLNAKTRAELTVTHERLTLALKKKNPVMSDIGDGLRRIFTLEDRGALKQLRSIRGQFYGLLGNLFRMRAYFSNLEKGLSPDEAAERVNTFMQTYSQVPRWVKSFGNTALGSPVVSFPYELVRVTKNAITKSPAAMMGLYGTHAAANVMAMGIAGSDPEMAREMIGRGLPAAAIGLLTRQYVPLPGGEAIVATLPHTRMFEDFINGNGMLSNMAAQYGSEQDPDSNGVAIQSALLKMGSNFMGGRPIFRAMQTFVTGQDVVTADALDGPLDTANSALKALAQPFIHRWTPKLGTYAQKLERTITAAPYAYSGRQQSALNTAIEEVTGLRIRGDVAAALERLPVGMDEPAKDLALRFTKLNLASQLFRWPDDQEMVLGKNGGKGLTHEDYLAMVIIKSAYGDPSHGFDRASAQDSNEKDLRSAVRLMESEDPDIRAWGKERLDEAMARYEDFLERDDMLKGGLRKATKKDKALVLSRILEHTKGPGNALSNLSLLRRTFVLGKMLTTKAPPQALIQNLFEDYVIGESGELRQSTSPEEIEMSMELLRRIVDSSDVALTPHSQRVYDTVRGFLVQMKPNAYSAAVRQEFQTERFKQLFEFYERHGMDPSEISLFRKPKTADIDMSRPIIRNADGSISTERTITIGVEEDGKEVFINIPTIVGGKQLSEEDAIREFEAGNNPAVGRFDSIEKAENAAKARSQKIGELRK